MAIVATAFVGTALIGCRSAQPSRTVRKTIRAPVAEVKVHGDGTCIDGSSANHRLRATLIQLGANRSNLQVVVVAEVSTERPDPSRPESPTRVKLTVRRTHGEVGLERDYILYSEDCSSALGLLAVALERFFGRFPTWREAKTPKPSRAISTPNRRANVTLRAELDGEWIPAGGAVQIEGTADLQVSVRHRFGLTASVRASAPLALGPGHYQQTTVLGGVRWRHTGRLWQPTIGVRMGKVLVSGFGYSSNEQNWLAWLEGTLGLSRRLAGMWVGIHLTAAPMTHRAFTADQLFSRRIPNVRFGAAVEIPLWEQKK